MGDVPLTCCGPGIESSAIWADRARRGVCPLPDGDEPVFQDLC